MSTPPDPLTLLRQLPPGSLVPAGWVVELVETGGLQLRDVDPGLTVEAVAELTGRAPGTVRTWCVEGRLPGARKLRGREWRIPRSAVAALVAGEESTPPAPTAGRLQAPAGGLGAWRQVR